MLTYHNTLLTISFTEIRKTVNFVCLYSLYVGSNFSVDIAWYIILNYNTNLIKIVL